MFDRVERAKVEWEATTDALRQLVLLLDTEGRVIRANRVLEQWNLGPVEAAVGRPFHQLIHPGCHRPRCPLDLDWEQTRLELDRGHSIGFTWQDPDAERFLSIELRPMVPEKKHPHSRKSHSVAVVEDISERRKAEEALRRSEEKFAKAFHSSPATMCISRNQDGLFFEVNEAFEALSGYSRAEAIGQTSLGLDLWVNPQDRTDVLDALRSEGIVRDREVQFRSRSGQPLVCRYSAETITLGGAPCVLSTVIDITERKWAEDALRREKAFSDAVLDSVPGLIYLFDERGILVGCNKKTEETTGYSVEEIGSKHIMDWLAEAGNDLEPIQAAFARVVREGYADGEVRIFSREGPRILFANGVRLVIDQKEYIVGIGTDITERKRAEEELRRHRNMLAHILNSVPLSIFWKDRDSVYQGCNANFARQMGISSSEEVLGRTDFDFHLRPEDAERIQNDDRGIVASNQPMYRYVEPFLQADGTETWMDITKVPLADDAGNVTGILGVYENVSERVHAEGQIRQLVAELKLILQVLPIQFWKLDGDGTIIGWDVENAGMAGAFPEDAIGRKFCTLFPSPLNERIHQAVSQTQRTQTPVKLSYELPIHGEAQFLEAQFLPLIERQVFVITRNITEQMRLESIAQSVEMMNNFGYIFSGIRHEIGNPINSIKIAMSVLRSQVDRYSRDKILEYVDRVLSEIGRVEYLLRSLKNFNMFESLKLRNVDLVSFMNDFLALIREDFGRQGIEVVSAVDPLSGSVYCDPRALHQLLLNLIGNAADALAGRADRRIEVRTVRRRGRKEIALLDNGCGMTPDQQANLFRPFFTSKVNGTGLGLVIVKKLLAQMDGTIEIESREGLGTTVVITLPGESTN
ncbi:MAG TPA: PAS domain S-box protein [Candidatus Aminicenantes bacterium]|nr:PAS domain S-box protein [Candidatus Aminicenantes bacterium]